MKSDYFPVHAHSQFSTMDGMDRVAAMVDRVVELGQPGLALTDHGNMAGAVRLYKSCQKAGIAAFPGEEFYLVRDVHDPTTKATRYHIGMMALDQKGYEALTKLSTLSWQSDRFYYKPLIDLSDLAFLSDDGYSDHIAVTSGCYSSMAVQQYVNIGDAEPILLMMKRWFPNTFYVELQNHGITWDSEAWGRVTDGDIARHLYDVAQRHGIPVVMGGDSHYIYASEQPVHDLMKDICYFGAGEDVHFDGGPYHLLTTDEAKRPWTNVMWSDIEAGHADLLDRNRLRLKPLDKYKFQVPRLYKDADDRLRVLAEQGLQMKFNNVSQTYWDRLDFELDVITKMGMSNYFLLVKEHMTDWCRDNNIIVNTRGSANGSLVCFTVGITNVDPLVWNTSFERFLSLDRMKPPDIDIDVDFRGRQRLISHMRAVYPTMMQVGTYAQIGLGKPDPETGEETGSVIVQYMAAMRKKEPNFNGKVKPEHWDALNALSAKDSNGNGPVFKSMGTNAAGFILPGDNHPIDKYLPLARIISSDTKVTQMTKDDVEALGYLKVDILGLRALQTLNGTLDRIGKPQNEWDWIPVDDKAACGLIRKGRTAGIFQYEGYTNRKGAMEMKVKTTLDCILGIALYRPALINGGQKDQYLDNRGKPKSRQTRLHPLFDSVLDDTAGVPLYQEQVMEMLKTLGMGFKDYNDLMTAIKASNGFIHGARDTFKRIMPIFYDLCESKGLTDEDADDAWGAVVGFTEYGFNRAHSTSYGLMAYYAAYLKAHYPLDFIASALSVWAGTEKEREYASEARRMGFSIVKADVNDSEATWTVDPSRKNALRKGLVSLPGIGEPTADVIVSERHENGPYTSIQDFVDRTPRRPVTGGGDWKNKQELKGVCKVLYEANAFRSMNNQ